MIAKRMFALLAAVAACGVAGAAEYYVDAKNGNDDWDGSASNHVSGTVGPKQTLQAAADLIKDSKGHTIWVLPGVYDKGGRQHQTAKEGTYYLTNRLYLAYSNVKVISTGGKEVTHIVGASDPTTANGCGPAAVRCVKGPGKGVTTYLEGFTLRDGRNYSDNGKNNEDRGGGAQTVCLYDCTVSNCVANARGGGADSSTLVRCRIIGNTAGSSSYGMACIASSLANCLVARNYGGVTLAYSGTMVNVSVVGNAGGDPLCGVTGTPIFYNCLFAGNHNGQNGFSSFNNAQTTHCTNSVCERRACFTYVNDGEGGSVTNAPLGQCLSSALGDAHLVPGSVAIGRGEAAYLAQIKLPDGYTQKDLEGNDLPASGAINCGCYQTTATPTGARVDFNADYQWDVGEKVPVSKYATHYFTGPAETLKVKPVLSSGFLYGIYSSSENNAGGNNYRIPLDDGYVRIVANPDTDFVISLQVRLGNKKYYVDAENGNDDWDGLSATQQSDEKGPKKTLAGVCAVAGAKDFNLVCVAPGVYSNETCSGTVKARLSVSKAVGFVSSGGTGTATIRGGDNIRCAFLGAANAFLRGFVLEGANATSSETSDAYRGLAVYATSVTSKILDCTITNCASKYVVVYRGTMLRSKVLDCRVADGPLTQLTKCATCLFAGNTFGDDADDGNTIFMDRAEAYLCTIDAGNGRVYHSGDLAAIGNVVVRRAGGGNPPAEAYLDNVENLDPAFVSRANRDFRLGVLSPALGAVDPASLVVSNASFYLSTDIDGRPLRAVNGRITAGAVHNDPLPCVVVSETGATGSLAVENGIVGTNAVPQDAAPIVLTATGARPFVGFTLDGAAVSTATSYTAPSVSGTEAKTVGAVFTNVWHVAKTGDDAAGGGSWLSPKATIPAAADKAVSGDTVLVGPGTYGAEGGTMLQTAAIVKKPFTLPSRVWVKEGVTLASTDGAEKTVILGARATGEDRDDYGNGSNAVRCVALAANATIRGFTLTGGASAAATNVVYTDDFATGAVIGGERPTSIVRDCIVSNNVAASCGGGFRCRFVNTRIFDNVGRFRASAGRECDYIGCVIDRNRGGQLCEHYWVFDSTTIGANNYAVNGTGRPNTLQYPRDGAAVVNSVILMPEGVFGGSAVAAGYTYTATNTVYMKGSGPSTANPLLVDCIFTNAAACALDEDLRPIVGQSILVDKGRTDCSKALANSLTEDASGFQRVMNGTRDIGALEGDWRGNYAEAITRSPRFAVTEATPLVIRESPTAGDVTITNGAALAATWRSDAVGDKYRLTVRATGAGTLTVTQNDAVVATVTAAEGEKTLTLWSGALTDALGFAYAGGDGYGVVRRLAGARGAAIIVR